MAIDFAWSTGVTHGLLACVATGGVHLLALWHAQSAEDKYRPMFIALGIGLLLWGGLPFWFHDAPVGGGSWWLERLTGLLIYGAFVIGYLELNSLLNRGYSMSILLQIVSSERPLTIEEMGRAYGGERGLNWLMEKRLQGLVDLGFAKKDEGDLVLSPRGKKLAHVLSRMIGFLGLRRFG